MKRNLFALTLRNKLIIAFTVILLVPSLTIGWFSYQTAKAQIEKRMNMTVNENVRVSDEMLSSYIESITTDIDFLSRTLKLNANQPTSVAELLPQMDVFQKVHAQVETAYVGTSKGEMLLSPQQELPKDFDPRTRPWYETAMQSDGKVVITAPYINATDGKIVVTIAKSIPNGAGVVGVDLNLEALSKQIESIKIGKDGYVSIADTTKKFLIHPHSQPGAAVPDDIAAQMYGAQKASFTFEEKGITMREVVTTNKLTGWKLAGTFSVNEIDKDASTILNQTLLVVLVCLVIGAALIYIIIRAIVQPIRALIKVSEQVSEGDLTVSLDVSGAQKDEITKLSKSFNAMIVSLKSLLTEVNETSHQLAASSEQLSASSDQTSVATQFIAENIQQMAIGSETQVESVKVGSASVGEMSRGVEEIAANAQSVTDVAVQTSHISAEGNSAIETAITQMQSIERTFEELSQVITDLTQQSAEISQMVNLIQDISTQTNLLSLNASIEAARAGEHGRGFAVVAQEVKKLAEQAAASSKSVIELVQSMQGGTERAVESMNATSVEVTAGIAVISRAGALFKQIQGSVLAVEAQLKEVSQVSQQISNDGHETVNAINTISGVVQETALATQNVSAAAQQQLASMEEIAASAAFLTKMAEDLQQRVERFKL